VPADAQDPREIALLEQVLVVAALVDLEEDAALRGVSAEDISSLVAAVTDNVVGQDTKLCVRVVRCMLPGREVPEVCGQPLSLTRRPMFFFAGFQGTEKHVLTARLFFRGRRRWCSCWGPSASCRCNCGRRS